MKVPELSNLKYSYSVAPEELSQYSYSAKFTIPKLFPDLHGRVIFLEPDIIVQGKQNYGWCTKQAKQAKQFSSF